MRHPNPGQPFVSEISAEDKRASSCDGKERFDSFQLANKVAVRHNRQHCRRTSYRCPHCGGYHLGTPSLGRKQKVKR